MNQAIKIETKKLDNLTQAELTFIGGRLQEVETKEEKEIKELRRLIALYPNLTDKYLNEFWEEKDKEIKEFKN